MFTIYCSEAAAVCGLNPFVSISDALEKIWRERWDNGRSYQECKQRLERIYHRPITSRQEQVQCMIQSTPELVNILHRAQNVSNNNTTNNQSMEIIVQNVQDEIKNIIGPGTRNSHLKDDVSRELSSQVMCSYGRQAEQQYIETAPVEKKIYNNNDKFYIKKIHFRENFIQIGGRIDGLLDDGTLVEIKNRKSRLFSTIPVYEQIQVHCYMFLLEKPNCKIIQRLKSSEQNEKTVEWDEKLWTTIVERLDKFTKLFYYFINNFNVQEEFLLLANDKERQKEFIYGILQNF
jgi:hypothetical protein